MNIGLLETILICMKCFFGIPDNIPYFQLLYPPQKKFSLPHTLSFENYCQKSGGISNKPNIFNPRKSWVFSSETKTFGPANYNSILFCSLPFKTSKLLKKKVHVWKRKKESVKASNSLIFGNTCWTTADNNCWCSPKPVVLSPRKSARTKMPNITFCCQSL